MDIHIKSLIKKYVKECKAGNFDNTEVIANKLLQLNITTTFAIDYIYFTNWHTNQVLYSFEL